MIGYTLKRSPGGRRYSSTDRAAARLLTMTGAPPNLSPAAVAAMTDPNGIEVVADVLFEVESNRLRRPVDVALLIDGADVTGTAVGDPSQLVNARRTTSPSEPGVSFPGIRVADLSTVDAVVELTWSGFRPVNVVEVHGDSVVGQVTAASVDVLTAPGGPWVPAGAASAIGGRLAVVVAPYASPELCYGVRVHVEDTDRTGARPVSVVEVDPMFVRDVSDVVELSVEWAREADPGASSSPVGNYEASKVTLTLDDTEGQWNPATNGALDVGCRIEVALGVRYRSGGLLVDELLPAGVFYSEPFDTDSDSTEVTIEGVDRLGRNSEVTVSEEVAVDATVEEILLGLARKYLDLDADQVFVTPSIAGVVIPYAYPSGNLGSYFADLAKATAATIHVDALDRLVLERRADTATEPVAVFTNETSLISFRRPPGYDLTTSIVNVTASPLAPDEESELWAMPSGGISIGLGETYTLIAAYGTVPAVDVSASGIVADGLFTVTESAFYADRAELKIRNDEARTLVVADARILGKALIASTLTARAEDVPSVNRYGPRALEVDARLAQTQAQVETVAAVLLDAFRSLDDSGRPRSPDLTFDALGVMHLTAGDRVTLAHPPRGLGGDYTILSRKLTYAPPSLLLNDVRVREAPTDRILVLDSGMMLDDGNVVGY